MMTMTSAFRRATVATAAALFTAAALAIVASAAAVKFYDDDPVWMERDTQDASNVPPLKIDLFVDLTYNLFGRPGDPTANVRAQNVNTVDAVPDSSWFTNRIGHRPMTADEIAKGPTTTSGPAAGRWTVTASKTDGVTPGFTIKDANGQRWFLKFDPAGHRALATGPEVAVSKLFWALGYNVTENHIAYFRREQIVVGEGATFEPVSGTRRPMQAVDIDQLLEQVGREPNGSYRVIASKGVDGTPLGGFRFYDTRPDDPNDIVPHEHRRELRGLGVFAAWVNMVDSKAGNMLDVLVRENNRAYVRHYVQDVGATLGSGALGPAEYWEGHELLVEPGVALKQMLAFGFYIPRWHTVDTYESKSFGRLPRDNTHFNADAWKPRFPNQAFLRARADDKFWAAQKLIAVTDDMLRAAVRTGDLGDEKAEEFLVKALAERRDAIGRRYLTAINPVADPALDAAGVLTFRNAAVDAGFAKAPAGYRAVWSHFDNAAGTTQKIGETTCQPQCPAAPAELSRSAGAFVKLELSALDGPHASWQTPVHTYFRRTANGWRLVGFERMPEKQDGSR
jgi:hypothetical protein